jgi:hypothetical protein
VHDDERHSLNDDRAMKARPRGPHLLQEFIDDGLLPIRRDEEVGDRDEPCVLPGVSPGDGGVAAPVDEAVMILVVREMRFRIRRCDLMMAYAGLVRRRASASCPVASRRARMLLAFAKLACIAILLRQPAFRGLRRLGDSFPFHRLSDAF